MASPLARSGVEEAADALVVRDWPDRDAVWRVSTTEIHDRRLQVRGWTDWKDNQLVGTLDLHITTRKALLIRDRWVADTLVTPDRVDVLAAMVACAEEIAARLKAHGIGDGCLEWELEHGDFDYVKRLFGDYEPRKRGLRRGKRYLRKRITDA